MFSLNNILAALKRITDVEKFLKAFRITSSLYVVTNIWKIGTKCTANIFNTMQSYKNSMAGEKKNDVWHFYVYKTIPFVPPTKLEEVDIKQF